MEKPDKKPEGTSSLKVTVASSGRSLDACVGQRLDECPYLLTVDCDSLEFEAIQNPLLSPNRQAAIKLLKQLLADNEAGTILVGGQESSSCERLDKYKIRVVPGMNGSVREAVEKFQQLEKAPAS